MDCFIVANHEDYSIGDIFLEHEAVPKITTGYGNIKGAYSVGGIKTYKISSPMYVPAENALLEFDVYFPQTEMLNVSVDVANVEKVQERFTCNIEIKGGGKWKRIILKAADFKGEIGNMPLENFHDGRALFFSCDNEDVEFSVTNILWL